MDDRLHLLLRFAHYAVLLGLFGLTAFRSLGLRRLAIGSRIGGGGHSATAFALLAPVLSAALMLVSIAAMMGQSLVSLDRNVIEAMIVSTSFGWAFLLRFALLLCAVSAMLARSRAEWAWTVAALFYGGALLTLPWSGHAAATEGSIGLLHRSNGGLHLLSAGLWLGAIGWFTGLVVQAHRGTGCFAPEVLLAAMHRFKPLGIALVAIVALTGIINADLVYGLSNSADVVRTTYGQLLIAKIALVGVMLLCAARHSATIRNRLEGEDIVGPGEMLVALRTSLTVEALIAVAVLAIVAILGMSSPMDG